MLYNYRKKKLTDEQLIRRMNPMFYAFLWKRDGSQFLSDDAYGRLCAATGAAWTPQGRIFDGDDYIDIPEAFSSLAVGTLETWMRLNTVGIAHDIIASSAPYAGAGNKDNFLYFNPINTNVLRFHATVNGVEILLVDTIETLTRANWYHAVVTMSAAGNAMYLNGRKAEVSYSTGTAATQVFFSSLPAAQETYIGRFLYRDTYYARLNGILGEVAIYNRALTPMEVQAKYLAGKWRYR